MYLTGVTANAERDGNADAEDVDDDPDKHHFYGKGEFCGCGELYDDAIHEEVDGDAVKDAGHDGVVEQRGTTRLARKNTVAAPKAMTKCNARPRSAVEVPPE